MAISKSLSVGSEKKDMGEASCPPISFDSQGINYSLGVAPAIVNNLFERRDMEGQFSAFISSGIKYC